MYLQHCKCTKQIHGEGPQILITSYFTAAVNSCYSLIARLHEPWTLFVVNFAQENWVFTTILAEMLIITIMIKWWELETSVGMKVETEGCQLVWLWRKMCCKKSGLWLCHLLGTVGLAESPGLSHPTAGTPREDNEALKRYTDSTAAPTPTALRKLRNEEAWARSEKRRKYLQEHSIVQSRKSDTRRARGETPRSYT